MLISFISLYTNYFICFHAKTRVGAFFNFNFLYVNCLLQRKRPPPYTHTHRCYVLVLSVNQNIIFIIFCLFCSSRTQQAEMSARNRRSKEMLRATRDRELRRLWRHETRQQPEHEILNSLFCRMIQIYLLDIIFFFLNNWIQQNAEILEDNKYDTYVTYISDCVHSISIRLLCIIIYVHVYNIHNVFVRYLCLR